LSSCPFHLLLLRPECPGLQNFAFVAWNVYSIGYSETLTCSCLHLTHSSVDIRFH
jgi:hypothetical protein